MPRPEPVDYSTLLTVGRAFAVLETLSNERELGVMDITKKVGLNRSTAYRLLSTLKQLRYVQQNSVTSKYFLSPRLLAVGNRAIGARGLRELGGPLAAALSRELGRSTYLGIRDEGMVVHIDGYALAKAGPNQYRLFGESVPVHCTALGKAIIAFLPAEERRKAIVNSGLKRFTPSTLTDIASVEEDLALTRERGYSVNNEEGELGSRSVAAPIRDASGTPFGALCVRLPITKGENLEQIQPIGERVCQVADEISRRLGYLAPVSVSSARALAS